MFGPAKRIGIRSDDAGVIRRSDRARVQRALQHVTLRFPQVFAALFTGSAGHIRHLRPYAFWLLNRSKFTDLEENHQNRDGILLLIDPSTKSATFSFGYLLEPFLDENDTFECLSRAHAYWLDGQYADGAIKALVHLETILRSRSRQSGSIAKRLHAAHPTHTAEEGRN